MQGAIAAVKTAPFLDHGYIESWADQMGLETIWRTIKYLVKQQTRS